MIGPARRWEARRAQLAARKSPIRVDRAFLVADEQGTAYIVIEGFRLIPAITPPTITVGGVPLGQVRVEQGGRRLSGTLPQQPQNDEVIVDLGYAQVRGEVTARGDGSERGN